MHADCYLQGTRINSHPWTPSVQPNAFLSFLPFQNVAGFFWVPRWTSLPKVTAWPPPTSPQITPRYHCRIHLKYDASEIYNNRWVCFNSEIILYVQSSKFQHQRVVAHVIIIRKKHSEQKENSQQPGPLLARRKRPAIKRWDRQGLICQEWVPLE